MVNYDYDKTRDKIRIIKIKERELSIILDEFRDIRVKLIGILDSVKSEYNPDGTVKTDDNGKPILIITTPKDEVLNSKISDTRRNTIYTELITRADTELTKLDNLSSTD